MTEKKLILTRCIAQSLLVVSCLLQTWGYADVSAVVDSVERLPRTGRLAAYEAAMVRPGISEADRVSLIRAFAPHAKCVSPLYGPTSYRFDLSCWFAILDYGFKADPADADVMEALCKLLINHQKYREALPVAAAFEKAHPEHVGVPGATMSTETNIMTSVGEEYGSGGQRNLGCTEAQAALILYHAKRTYQRLGLSEPRP
jgi:hypothetical protein